MRDLPEAFGYGMLFTGVLIAVDKLIQFVSYLHSAWISFF